MQIKIFDVANDGTETLRCYADVADCFDCADPEFHTAIRELREHGRYWAGGGAAPLVLLLPLRVTI